MNTLRESILSTEVEQAIQHLVANADDDPAENPKIIAIWLNELNNNLKAANVIQLNEARRRFYMNKVIEVGRIRRRGFPDFNEGDADLRSDFCCRINHVPFIRHLGASARRLDIWRNARHQSIRHRQRL